MSSAGKTRHLDVLRLESMAPLCCAGVKPRPAEVRAHSCRPVKTGRASRQSGMQPAATAADKAAAVAAVEGEGAAPGRPAHGPAAWTAAEALACASEWQYTLSAAEAEEIVAAAKRAVTGGKPVPALTQADFPLPRLAPKLAAWRDAALHGRGFQLLRGFPVERLNRQEVVTAFYGLGTHWGNARSQNAKGHVVGHVKDLGLDPDAPDVRVYATKIAQPWHVDTCDLVALLCLQKAKAGGRSAWVSSLAVYNRLLAERPDLVEELRAPFYYDRKGETQPGERGFFGRPVLSFYGGWLTFYFNDRMIREAQRFPDVPRLTPKQEEALQAVADLASDPALHLEWDLEPGDIQLLHNWTQLHMRTAFEDHPELQRRRHLLRLHLSHEAARPLDPAWYGSDPPGQRLGVYAAGTVHTAPLEAE